MTYNDIVMTCDFCKKKRKFIEMTQICLLSLTTEEVEEFRKKGKTPLKLEFAMRCNKCKERGIITTISGYTIDTIPIEAISLEKAIEIEIERDIGRYKASIFKKRKK